MRVCMDSLVAREHMIESQLLTNDVLDADIIDATRNTPREWFVPKKYREMAYLDEDLPVTADRYVMEPLGFSRLLQQAQVTTSDKVLHLGCTTGYGTALLAQLADKVIAVESEGKLAQQARQNLQKLGLENAEVITASYTGGHSTAAPYDVIILEGAVENVPDVLKEQLAEGGRLVGVEKISQRIDNGGLGRIFTLKKMKGKLFKSLAQDLSVPVLPGFEGVTTFTF